MPIARLEIATHRKRELIDVTLRVAQAVRAAGLADGAVLVWSPHTTAGVTVQENADPDVQHDVLLALENAVPEIAPRGEYRHAEGNADAHVKTALTGNSQLVPVENGKLVLGTWQAIYLCEFDGPRSRKLFLQFLGAAE
ncbi:MAG TPA: secondary thiamine-phosphate synthase enzyme YjbQ [Anaeromyxobacteraceae bacterium]|jgi:secondary thiamine-phosphate synthase enzyme|nr:secondary thiamine-phosphate synthase enzyme YjbQ [Anaeromyxobacteraceae bacterium]